MNKPEISIMHCDTSVKNIGVVGCAYDPANIVGNLFTKKGTVITKAMASAIQSTITGWLAEDDPKDRAHIITCYEGVENKNTESVYNESPYGVRRKVRNGKYGRRYEYRDGALALHTKLSTFDGKQDLYDVFEIDQVNNCLWGTKVATGMKGFTLDLIDVPNFDLNNGADPTKYYLELAYSNSDEFNKRPAFLKLPDDLSIVNDFPSMIDTEMEVAIAMDPVGLVSLRFTAGNGAVNLGDDYDNTLDEQTLYVATDVATGADLDIDSVAWNPATGNIDLQLDATDPDFPASGALIKIDFGPASAIESNGMPGYSEASVITPLG